MFIKTESYLYETNHIAFALDGSEITFTALHDNDIRTIPCSSIISISKIHPMA